MQRLINQSKPQPIVAESRQKPEDTRQNLSFWLRLWFIFPRHRWLFWSLTITLSLMLGASLALMTPLWSSRARLKQGQLLSLGTAKPQDSDVWSSGFQYQLSRPLNILVMGIGPQPGVSETSPNVFTGISSTMLLLQVDPNDKSVKVISIPRDSQVVIPGIGLAKISLANARGGSSLAARVVSRTLNNVPIHRYIRITIDAFRELVDLLGGVEVFVPQRMLDRDTSPQLEIDLAQGWQNLDGDQAEQFVRFRDSKFGDIGRVQRQQILLKALRDRLTSPNVLPHLPEISRIMLKYIDTNLSLEEMFALANFGAEDQQNFQMVLLPGTLSRLSKDPSSYWLDAAGANRILAEYFGVKSIGAASKMRSLTTLKIAIQNASGQSSLTERVVKELKQQGLSNVYIVSDWPDQQRQTQIIVQKGDLEAAAELQKVMRKGNIEAASTGDLKSDLTIRVGKDWEFK